MGPLPTPAHCIPALYPAYGSHSRHQASGYTMQIPSAQTLLSRQQAFRLCQGRCSSQLLSVPGQGL